MSGITRTHRALAGLCRRHARRRAEAGRPPVAVDARVRGYERNDGYRTVTASCDDADELRELWAEVAPLLASEMGNARVHVEFGSSGNGCATIHANAWRHDAKVVEALPGPA